jgi:predicted DsbA family dithiol-disulfide isomerase
MKVEIWSDVMCPFCYIGKHRFEQALKQFDFSDDIDIDWKSFQLNPNLETQPGKNITEHLAEVKDWSLERADQMNRHVSTMASEAGLNFNLDKAVIANSFNAHRFVHFAKTNGKGNEAEESLFKAYFTKGQNIDDIDTLVELGESLGLNNEETRLVLESDKFANAVKQDILAARNLGIQGVPFFLFNRKYAISGAREIEVFEQALQKSWQEWNNESPMEPAD